MKQTISPCEAIVTCLILIAAVLILLYTFSNPILVIKGIMFTLCMTAISYCDAKTETIPDSLLILLIPIGLIDVGWESFAGIAIALPFLIFALAIKNCIGGGDIKMLAAYGFVLGHCAIMGMLFGFTLFTVTHLYAHINKKRSTYALGAFLHLF